MTKRQLKEYCDAEYENIHAVLKELDTVFKKGKSRYSIAELAAMATFVHNFYNGMENILKLVLRSRNVKIANTPAWHKELISISLNKGIISKEI